MYSAIELLRREIYRFMSIWVQTIIGPLSTALLYQLIFGNQLVQLSTGIPGISYTTFLIPGLVMMQVLLNSFANSSSSLIQSKYTGNIIFVLMAPISPFYVYISYLTASIVRGVVVGSAVLLGIGWFGISMPYSFAALFFFLLCGSAIGGGIGIIVGILSNRFEQLAGFQSFIMTPLIYLSGIFFNPSNFDGFWRQLAFLDPFLYIVDGFRYGFIGHTSVDIQFGVIFVLLMTIGVNVVGYWLIKKGVRIKN